MKKTILVSLAGLVLVLAGCTQQAPTANQGINQPTANVNQNVNEPVVNQNQNTNQPLANQNLNTNQPSANVNQNINATPTPANNTSGIDNEWNIFQEFLSVLKSNDLTKINAASYKPITQEELDMGAADMLYQIGSALKKNDFVNIERDNNQSIISTKPGSNDMVSTVYFIKKNNKLVVLVIQMNNSGVDSDKDGRADEDETCAGNIYKHFPDKCIKSDPGKKDTDGDGWWDGIEVAAGYSPTSK